MEQSATEATGSKSGQFRSRVTIAVSQRRLNASNSQSRELSNDSLRSESSNRKVFTPPVHESSTSYGFHCIWVFLSSIKWLLHIVAVAFTIGFTYDMIYGKESLFWSNKVQESEPYIIVPAIAC
jgi:hypothetical protein